MDKTFQSALFFVVAALLPLGEALAQEEAVAPQGKFDVKGGFFEKNAATAGLIEGADLGGRPHRNLSAEKHSRGQLRGRANLNAIRNGLLGAQGVIEEPAPEQVQRQDSFAIVPTVDDKGIGASPDSFAVPQRAAAPAPQQQPSNPEAAAAPDSITEGRSEEILQTVQQAQDGVRALGAGAPAPGTPEYTQRLIDQVKSQGDWRERSEERRRDVSGNRF